jgi:hypothetical protein
LEPLLAHGEATPSGIAKKPETIRRRLVPSRPQRRFAHGILKGFLRLARIAGHQETESIKLWKILGGGRHGIDSLTAKFTSVDCKDKGPFDAFPVAAALWAANQFAQYRRAARRFA